MTAAEQRAPRQSGERLSPAAVVMAVAFTIGVLWGSLLARSANPEGLESYLQGYLAAVGSGQLETSLPELAWKCLRMPLLAFLMSFTVLGVAGIPILMGVRGFGLAFAVGAFLRIYGTAGMLPALAVFGVTGLAAVPALLLIATAGWCAAGAQLKRSSLGRELFDRQFWLCCGGGALCVVLHMVIEYKAVLPLLTAAVGKM